MNFLSQLFLIFDLKGANNQQSYQQLLNNIRDILRNKYSQKPQLSSSHPMVRPDSLYALGRTLTAVFSTRIRTFCSFVNFSSMNREFESIRCMIV